MPMIINTFSYLWSSTAIDAICELAHAGFSEFEVPISSPHCWPNEMPPTVRSDGKKMLKDHAARVRSLNAGGYDLNLASPARSMRQKSIDHIKDVIELSVDWSATDVVISPGVRRPMISPSLEQTRGWLYESLGQLIPFAENAGVTLLFENTPYCFTPTIEELKGIVDEIGSPQVKIVYDVANAAYIEEDPAKALLSNASLIGLVHISDTGLDVWGHDPIGTGVVNFEQLRDAVEATSNTDNVVLEIIRAENPLGEINNGLEELTRRGWRI
jgi:L-ribulose-5-phosphate 3-epimerase